MPWWARAAGERSAECAAEGGEGRGVAEAEEVIERVMRGHPHHLVCGDIEERRPGVGEYRPSAGQPGPRAQAADMLGSRFDVSGDREVLDHSVVLSPQGDEASVRVGERAVEGLPEVPLQQVPRSVIQPGAND